jgi:integrase
MVKNINIVGNWHAKRNDDFAWKAAESPLTEQDRKGRTRVLEEHEIAAVWHACERQGHPHGTIVRVLLLTACRVKEITQLRRAEVVNGVIRLAPERIKTGVPLVLPLSKMALELLASCPPDSEWYFAGERSGGPFTAFSKPKRQLDAMLNIPHWTLHDLRRTAATLMAEQCEVHPHIVEAVLNHKGGYKAGVAGVYNKAQYEARKRDALEKLADCIHQLVH